MSLFGRQAGNGIFGPGMGGIIRPVSFGRDTGGSSSPPIVEVFHTEKGCTSATTVTTDPATSSGTFLTMSIGFSSGGGTIQDISDNYGNVWIRLPAHATGDASHVLAYAQNAFTGPGHTFTVRSQASIFPSISVVGYNNVLAFDALDQDTGHTGSGTTIQTGSLTPSSDDCMLVTGFCGTGITQSINQGFTVNSSVPSNASPPCVQVASASLVQTSASAQNPTWTTDVSSNLAASIASFKNGPILPAVGNIVFEGDSITQGVLANTIPYPAQLGIQWRISDLASAGETVNQMIGQVATVVAKYAPLLPRNIAHLLGGTNDILNSASAATVYSRIQTWCANLVSAGWPGEIWVATLLPAGGGSAVFNPVITDLNNLLIADHSFCTKLIRFDQVPQLQDPSDALYFQSDQLHETNLGAQFMAQTVVAAM